MRIQLDRDDARFGIAGSPQLGKLRYLTVMVGNKPFSVWRCYDDDEWLWPNHEERQRVIDEHLVKQMEFMLTKIFTEACAAIPEGTLNPGGINGSKD